MEIKYAKYENIENILNIINQAKEYFKQEKIFQWNSEYPNYDTIKRDIDKNTSFVVVDNNNIIATFALIIGEDKNYKKIYNGKWLTNGLYGTIHRIAIHNDYKRKGIANKILKYSEEYCLKNKVKSLRIDTHKLNRPMLSLIEKNNFTYCGIIKVEDLTDRIAYEKILL